MDNDCKNCEHDNQFSMTPSSKCLECLGYIDVKKKLRTHLISASVSLDYAQGFTRNMYITECKKDIEKALDLLI